jgi:DNA-directed RNA polymerase subunit RPC12/RpoP
VNMAEDQDGYECLRCGKRISKEEYETYSGLCEECSLHALLRGSFQFRLIQYF